MTKSVFDLIEKLLNSSPIEDWDYLIEDAFEAWKKEEKSEKIS